MRLLTPLLLTAALPACSLGYHAERTDAVSFAIGDAAHVHVQNRNGSVAVRAGDSGTLSGSSVYKARAGSQAAADARVAQMDWESRREGDTLVLTLKGPDDDQRDYGASLDLVVPAGVSLELESGNGGIRVEGDFPRVVLSTSNGKIHVAGDGRVRARTSNGPITYVGASADFELRTSNGGVEAELVGDWGGRGVIDTSNGSVKVQCAGKLAAVVQATTSNGKVRTEGVTEEGDGKLRIDTSNGSVTVRATPAVAAEPAAEPAPPAGGTR